MDSRTAQPVLPAKRPAEDDIEDFIMDDYEVDIPEEESQQPPEDVVIDLGEAGKNWMRPPCPTIDPQKDAIVFQQVDMDYIITPPHKVLASKLRHVPVIRMFGVNENGNSVCAFIHGYEPYFYIEKPSTWGLEEMEDLQAHLNKTVQGKGGSSSDPMVVRIEGEHKTPIWHFQDGKKRPFLKIVTNLPNNVTPLRSALESGVQLPGLERGVVTYESNVLFALRFMVDKSVVGANWIRLPPATYMLSPAHTQRSFCQIEVDIHSNDMECLPVDGEYSKLAPLRILSIDIECSGRKGVFPEPQHDPVIQIASLVTVQGSSGPLVKNIMTLGTCAPIVGAEVMSFGTEADMLQRWRDLVLETDPDIIIGYNITNFDLPYLFDRAKALGIADKFHMWGRIKGSRVRMKEAQFSSKAYGTHEYKDLTIEGRVQFDVYLAIQRDHKLSSYSLNAVSAHFLGEQKEDVHHSIINDLQNGNEETRRRLAVYCLKDALLPQRLVDRLMYMYNYVEMARVTGVPMSFLLTKGQSVKVFSQLLRKARSKGYLIPNMKVQGASGDGVAYEGATVLDPQIGFYEKPVATLDFASLYPSIMMAHNLCYTTLVPKDRIQDMAPEDIEKAPTGDTFVKAHKLKGILPEILEELLNARKRAKADLKKEKDPSRKAVLDGRQLALKVSANSVYGFTGATVGKMPCLEISSSVTAYGRDMIMHTKKLVEATYCKAKGYEADCVVIYGDTDSVMVNFQVPDVRRAMELGQEAADFISETFPRPVKLEFEKVYYPYLLMNKKRYAGLLWTNPDKHDKMDTKGIETVRRDNCLLVRNMVTTCLEKILIDKDIPGAVSFVKSIISELLTNRVDMSLLVVSKGLTQDAESYDKVKMAHVELAKKMRKRDPATAPSIGDRVPYVIIKAAKGAKAYEKAEDPIYALEHNLPIDAQHYLEHHLSQPLIRIFEPVMKNPKDLLSGDHTRSITVSTPSTAAGGIMRFAKVRHSCMGCKAPLEQGKSSALCDHCQARGAEIYMRTLGSINELENQYGRLWTQCQRCQGSLHMDVLCTSRDCPIFYRRRKVQKDLNEAQAQLTRFADIF